MAYSRVNWQNSPSTSTPINATNLNNMDAAIKTNDDKLLGNAPMGNVVVDSIRSKNMWQPILVGNQNNCNVSLSGNTYTFAATGSDMFYGNIASTGTSYTTGMGELFKVQPSTTYSLSLSNSNFSKNYVSFFNSSKVSLSYQRYDSNSFSFTTPSNCYYICIRIGNGNSVNGTNYSTTIQLEAGATSTTFSSYQELNGEIYSFGEVKIGTWVDGKPLYRSVYSITNPQSSNIDYHNISNLHIQNIIRLYGYYKTPNGTFDVPFHDSDSNYSVMFLSNAGYLRGRFGSPTDITEIKVIIEYTKTTD